MLSREAAQERLKTFKLEDGKERRIRRLHELTPACRRFGLDLLGEGNNRKKGATWGERQAAFYRAFTAFDEFSTTRRQQVFEALFPTLHLFVEQSWQLLMNLPYLTGLTRKAFRVPNGLHATRNRRADWLSNVLRVTANYEEDFEWFAAWTPHITWMEADDLGILFAAAMNSSLPVGDDVFDILKASALGEHEVGSMGRHVSRALLVASRPDGWKLMENMLVAAQRQEGLRQVILETVDEAHPAAFRRMLTVIQEHNLARFSSAVRAINVWFGFSWETGQTRSVNQVLEQLSSFLDDSGACQRAIEGDDDGEAYLALWSLAYVNALAALEPAETFLESPRVERRFVGTHLLAQLNLVGSQISLLPMLKDPDLRVSCRALQAFAGHVNDSIIDKGLFEHLEAVVERYPTRKKKLPPLVWPWLELTAERGPAMDTLIDSRGARPITDLFPYHSLMQPRHRRRVLESVVQNKPWDSTARQFIIESAGDTSNWVRDAAFHALKDEKTLTLSEMETLEALLTRRADDLRHGVLTLLLHQADTVILASAKRLMENSHSLQRRAGIELLRGMVETGRSASRCRHLILEFVGAPEICGKRGTDAHRDNPAR